jgi:uncharacterized membrane protein
MTIRAGSIDVSVNAAFAWRACTQLERFPEFLVGIDSCTKLADGRYAWTGRAFGLRRAWTSEWVERRRPELLSWRTDDPMVPDGRVFIEPLGPNRCRVSIELRYHAVSRLDRMLVSGPATRARLWFDLRSFKRWIEHQRAPSTRPMRRSLLGAVAEGPSRAPASALSVRSSEGRDVGSS